MARGTRWWNEPPLWAWLLMVIGIVSFAVLLPIVAQRTAPVEVPAQSATTTAAASSSAPSSAGASAVASASSGAAPSSEDGGPAKIVVLGDGDSAGAAAWPHLFVDELADAEVQVAAAAGAGYLVTGAGGKTIPEMVEDVDLADADVVIVFGSRNDGAGQADRVSQAAEGLFEAVAKAAPDARLLVIGPPWFSTAAPPAILENRDALRSAATAAKATFVDPLTARWFVDRPETVTSTGNPSGSGQLYLARLIGREVEKLLAG